MQHFHLVIQWYLRISLPRPASISVDVHGKPRSTRTAYFWVCRSYMCRSAKSCYAQKRRPLHVHAQSAALSSILLVERPGLKTRYHCIFLSFLQFSDPFLRCQGPPSVRTYCSFAKLQDSFSFPHPKISARPAVSYLFPWSSDSTHREQTSPCSLISTGAFLTPRSGATFTPVCDLFVMFISFYYFFTFSFAPFYILFSSPLPFHCFSFAVSQPPLVHTLMQV